jgi:hypothetical protein
MENQQPPTLQDFDDLSKSLEQKVRFFYRKAGATA